MLLYLSAVGVAFASNVVVASSVVIVVVVAVVVAIAAGVVGVATSGGGKVAPSRVKVHKGGENNEPSLFPKKTPTGKKIQTCKNVYILTLIKNSLGVTVSDLFYFKSKLKQFQVR
jgi:hypothetical protein